MRKSQNLFETSYGPTVQNALSFARRCGHLIGGLEQIQQVLKNEQIGLKLVDKRKPTDKSAKRVTRLLIVSNDGSDRFYRECEKLLTLYSNCLIGVQLDVSSEVLGNSFFGAGKSVKAMLVTRRDTTSKILSTMNVSNDNDETQEQG